MADKLYLNKPKFKIIKPKIATLIEKSDINLSDEDEYFNITDNDRFNKSLHFNFTFCPQEWQEIYKKKAEIIKTFRWKSHNRTYEVL